MANVEPEMSTTIENPGAVPKQMTLSNVLNSDLLHMQKEQVERSVNISRNFSSIEDKQTFLDSTALVPSKLTKVQTAQEGS